MKLLNSKAQEYIFLTTVLSQSKYHTVSITMFTVHTDLVYAIQNPHAKKNELFIFCHNTQKLR